MDVRFDSFLKGGLAGSFDPALLISFVEEAAPVGKVELVPRRAAML
jgi:hypothetical protein